ncbi:hypothetical protein EBX93_02890 [bacterium]|nr:hypothetical protein [bacterium]
MQSIATFCLISFALAQAGPLEVSIKSLEGKPAKLSDHAGSKATVVVFMQFECPISSEYSTELSRLSSLYNSKGVNFIGVIPNSDSDEMLKKDARDYKIIFPVLHDGKLELADSLGAKITPEVFLLDIKGTVIYSGRVDDSWTERLRRNVAPKKRDLAWAIESHLDGKSPEVKKTEAVGCPISRPLPRVSKGKVTYHRDIAPIIQEKCQACHRSGEVAPFTLASFNDAVRWKDLLVEVVEKKQMPPWLPSGGLHYRGERRLNDAEIALIRDWVKGGCAEGEFADAPLPKRFTEGWQLGEPDLILEAPEEMVLAPTGKDLFRCLVLPTNLTEDKVVVAYELRPGNRRVVHHTLHFLDTQGRGRNLEADWKKKNGAGETKGDSGPGYTSPMGVGFAPSGEMGGWAPGISPKFLPDNIGYFLPKGSDFIVQVHYHRTGREEKDRTRVGLYFAKKPAQRYVQPLVIPGQFLVIPANKPDFTVRNTIWLGQDVLMHSVDPHMHLIGRKFVMTITPPDAKPFEAIRIDEWDYNWQEIYFLKEPMRLKEGTKIEIEAVFDNTSNNPHNPSIPPKWVKFGEQTTDEMCFMFVGVTTDDNSRVAVRKSENGPINKRPGTIGPKKQP